MGFLLEIVRLGLGNLRLHMLRSILTALGIIFGVLAVIVMSSLGEGTKRQALAQIERLGAKNIIVRSQKPPETQNQQGGQQRSFVSRYGVTRADLAVIRENFPEAEAIVPLKEVGGQVIREGMRRTSQAFGTTPDLARVANLTIAQGRYLTPSDMDERASVCVIGAEIARMFFPLEDPLGKSLRIDTKPFMVVGVLGPVGLAAGAGTALVGRDLNLDVHVPMSAAREQFGDLVVRGTSGSMQANATEVSEIYIALKDRDRVIIDAERLRLVLKNRRPGLPDVALIVPYELLENARRTALTFNLIFGAIAAISLLVGGIGIMNIMLASVTERIREIGIRRALGATRRHIMWQFLVETGVLSAIGGLIGVGVGIGGSLLVGWAVKDMPTALTLWSILVSFAVATVTGLVFGLYPAKRAAAADPIEALRHD
ncbi:MAG: ABC transporter substrate-binding protein [Phycisphaerae bacterium]|nr:MAG: ABC transporter substrate-binding protein [Phycisphaerae bacterium]